MHLSREMFFPPACTSAGLLQDSFSLLCPPASTCGLQQGDRVVCSSLPLRICLHGGFMGGSSPAPKVKLCSAVIINILITACLSYQRSQPNLSPTTLLNCSWTGITCNENFFRPKAAFEYSLFVKESPGLLNNWRCQLYFSILQIVSHFVTVSRPRAFRHQHSTVWRRDSLRMTWILGA